MGYEQGPIPGQVDSENGLSRSQKRRRGEVEKKHAQKRASITRSVLTWIGAIGLTIAGATYLAKEANASLNESEESHHDIATYYPEMANHKLTGEFSFKLPNSNHEIRVYNFTDMKVDPEAAKAVFNFSEKMAKNNIELTFESPNGEKMEGKVQPDGQDTKTMFFIVDKDSPRLQWDQTPYDGATFKGENVDDGLVTITSIRVGDLERPGEELIYGNGVNEANATFMTEACQTTTHTQSDSDYEHQFTQEVFCNTTGSALLSRSLGNSYSEYTYTQSLFSFDFSSITGDALVSINTISEQMYRDMPSLPPVLTGN